MKLVGSTFCLLLVLWGTSSSASELGFRFSRTIISPSLSDVELLSVTLDSNVFAGTETGLPDMRLLDGRGGAVPYLVRKVQSTRALTVRKTWSASQPNVRLLEDGGLEITLQLADSDPRPRGLRLVSRLKNFEHRVRVFSSVAGDQWKPVGEETVIFDYSRYMDVRRDSIRFREMSDRQVRIVIDNITARQESELLALTRRLRGTEETEREEQVTIKRRPFRIERIEFWGQVKQERSAGDKKTDYVVGGFRVEQAPEEQQTVILIDSNREPLTSFKLDIAARNFSRRIAVEVEEKQGVKSSWRKIGESTLSRIDFKGLKQEELTVTFPESRRENYRLVIDNRDSPPLKVSSIEASGVEYEILFLASPDTQYHLVYSSADAEPPQYDTAAIRQVLSKGFQPAQAELGIVGSATDHPVALRWSGLLNNRGLLFGAIILLVIVLSWGLYHAVRRFDNLPGE